MMMIYFMGISLGLMITMFEVGWWYSIGGLILLLMIFMFSSVGGECLFFLGGMEVLVDFWGYSLVVVSIWVSVLSVMASQSVSGVYMSKWLGVLIFVLLLILLGSFMSFNMLEFYFYFESSLIPMFLIILGFGYQPERLQAGLYFIFYTLGASLPLLFLIIKLYFLVGDISMFNLLGVSFMEKWGFIHLLLLGAFLVKMPMVFTHLWLPKAHVEAPVSGSMILAGVLLKLGGYGLGRLGGLMLVFSSISGYIIGLSLVGMGYVSLICCQVNDLKALIAYSSVAHMGLVISGLFGGFKWGALGALVMMVGHGASSSGLFYMANVYYDRSSSRSLFLNKGLISVLPISSLMFFMLCSGNISIPPTINFWSEIYLMGSLLGFDTLMMLVFPIGSFLGVVFTMIMYSYTQHGKMVFGSGGVTTLMGRETLLILLHIIPLYLFFLNMGVVFE